MEAGSKPLGFSDDEKSLGDEEALRPALNLNQLEEIGMRY